MLQYIFRTLITSLLLCVVTITYAQQSDSLFVLPKDNGWILKHKVQDGETLFSIARRFHVPPAMLASANSMAYQSTVKKNSIINVPIGAYNQVKNKPANMGDACPLYYRVEDENSLYRISHRTGVMQRTVQNWNKLTDNSVRHGQILFLGWLLYDATNMVTNTPANEININTQSKKVVMGYGAEAGEHVPQGQEVKETKVSPTVQQQAHPTMQQKVIPQHAAPQTTGQTVVTKRPGEVITTIILPDTMSKEDSARVKLDSMLASLPPDGLTYMQQTDTEKNIVMQKGPAVFFETVKTANNTTFYAFHDSTARGTIIKVYAPGTDKTIFVKVIGPLPKTKQYYNSIIGISGGARKALGIKDYKDWCKLTYAKQP